VLIISKRGAVMRKLKLIIMLITAFQLLYVIPVLSQNDIIYLNSKLLGTHERSLVKFPHAKHVINVKCVSCHHNYDKYFNLIDDSEGMSCQECHKLFSTSENSVSLSIAFHRQCKECHQLANKKNKVGGPIMCGLCHKHKALE